MLPQTVFHVEKSTVICPFLKISLRGNWKRVSENVMHCSSTFWTTWINHGVAPLFDNGQFICLQTGRWTIITTISGAIGKKAFKWCTSNVSQLINICFNFIWHKLASENKTTVDNYLSARFSYSLDKTNFFFLSECHWQCYWRLVAVRLKQRINASTYHDPWFEKHILNVQQPKTGVETGGGIKIVIFIH